MTNTRHARIRFSLLSFLLGTAFACLSIVHWQLSRKADDLEQTVWQLREELGYLNVKDPNKVYVRQVESTEPLTWRYRVYLPPGKEYRLSQNAGRGRVGSAPEGLMGGGGSMSSAGLTGRFTMVVAFSPDARTGKSFLTIKAGQSLFGGAIDARAGETVGQT